MKNPVRLDGKQSDMTTSNDELVKKPSALPSGLPDCEVTLSRYSAITR